MVANMNLWPVATQTGFKSETYDESKDPIERVQMLVEAWKQTAVLHGFQCAQVLHLSCNLSNKDHQLVFLDDENRVRTRISKIKSLSVSATVDDASQKTCIAIEILGIHLWDQKEFRFILSLDRLPHVNLSSGYKEGLITKVLT